MPRKVGSIPTAFLLALLACFAACLGSGCGDRGRHAGTRFVWVVGQGPPAFDPQGPPDAVRAALERMRSRGLVERDADGRIVPAAAARWETSRDSLVWTFHLRVPLVYTDGTECPSGDFAQAIAAGLARRDHSTTRWLLGALTGLARARPGRPLPPLGLATPDAHTLVLHLDRPDSRLLEALALPGIATPWRRPAHAGGWGIGLGPYAPVAESPAQWVLARSPRATWLDAGRPVCDTLQVRFVIGAARVSFLLRREIPDLAWPLPPGIFALPKPAAYRTMARDASPARRLLLVMRADLPPTSKPAARHALVHGLNRGDLAERLGPNGGAPSAWLVGGAPFEFPARSEEEVRGWLERGDLGRSMHVGMTYSADGVAGEVARAMQNEWAQLGLDIELQPVRATAFGARALNPTGAHLLLVEEQALRDDPVSELAGYVLPMRDPPVGAFRTNWRTREFDPWIAPGASRIGFDRAFAERRLGEEDIVLPLAGLRWVWFERAGGPPAPFSPRYGPASFAPPPSSNVTTTRMSR